MFDSQFLHGWEGFRQLTIITEGEREARYLLPKSGNENYREKGEEPLIKLSDLVKIHYHENSLGETALMIQSPPSHNRWELQLEMRLRGDTGPNHIT